MKSYSTTRSSSLDKVLDMLLRRLPSQSATILKRCPVPRILPSLNLFSKIAAAFFSTSFAPAMEAELTTQSPTAKKTYHIRTLSFMLFPLSVKTMFLRTYNLSREFIISRTTGGESGCAAIARQYQG